MGDRLGTISGGAEKWWSVGERNDVGRVFQDIKQHMSKEGIPYLNERDDLGDIIRIYGPLANDPTVILIEAVGGAYALRGDYKSALGLTKDLIASSAKHMAKSPWLNKVLLRGEELATALAEDPVHAVRILEERMAFTLSQLGLNG